MPLRRLVTSVAVVVFGLLLIAACTATTSVQGWPRFHAGKAFSFSAPFELKGVPGQGIDSFVGRYSMPGITIGFDYGWYTGCNPRREEKVHIPGAREASLTVGHRAAAESDSLPYTVVLCATTRADKMITLGMFAECASPERQAVAIRILKSVALTIGAHR